MRVEVENELKIAKDILIRAYQSKFPTTEKIEEIYRETDFIKKIATLSDKVIQLCEDEKLTYKDSYFLLEFVYNSLKYKQEQVNL